MEATKNNEDERIEENCSGLLCCKILRNILCVGFELSVHIYSILAALQIPKFVKWWILKFLLSADFIHICTNLLWVMMVIVVGIPQNYFVWSWLEINKVCQQIWISKTHQTLHLEEKRQCTKDESGITIKCCLLSILWLASHHIRS